MHAALLSALVPKGCNFITPLTLMQQFLITLFFHFQSTVLHILYILHYGCCALKMTAINFATFILRHASEYDQYIIGIGRYIGIGGYIGIGQ